MRQEIEDMGALIEMRERLQVMGDGYILTNVISTLAKVIELQNHNMCAEILPPIKSKGE